VPIQSWTRVRSQKIQNSEGHKTEHLRGLVRGQSLDLDWKWNSYVTEAPIDDILMPVLVSRWPFARLPVSNTVRVLFRKLLLGHWACPHLVGRRD